ncbi:hypothetical protein Mal33_09370 [Rosistilla oblonga]|uniref:Tetratricopeptide repeat protein n=1 Tax=Rosistilla oblonga TaxID=2527990 RepID=A0A518IPF3_9BACT|nr:hypothetical protein Mal33_09370 [Rosistilla oblonga]
MEPVRKNRQQKRRNAFNFGAWIASRQWSKLLPAAPAVITALAIGGACVWTRSRSQALQPRYLKALSTAVESDQTEVAERYASKLVALGAENRPEVQWIQTVIDLRVGRLQNAQEKLIKLAPADTIGYPYAHLFVAKQIVQRNNIDPQTAAKLKHHLIAASSISVERQWTASTLSKIYVAENDLKSATRELEKVVQSKPEVWLLIANLKKQQGDEKGEQQAFAAAADHFSEQLKNDPNDNKNRLALAQATFQTEGFRATETILLEGLKRSPDAAEFRSALASLYVQHADDLRAKSSLQKLELSGVLELIERAIQLVPNHPIALQRLMLFLDESGIAEDKASQVLGDLLASGQANASVHLLVATRAMLTGDDATAKVHMDLGYQKNPNLPVLLNNMAWLVARQDPPQLDAAKSYADRALNLVGNKGEIANRFRDTRGHILVKMERWEEAIADLETAVPQLNDRAKAITLRALAKAYRALDQNEIAAAYEKQASTIGLDSPAID